MTSTVRVVAVSLGLALSITLTVVFNMTVLNGGRTVVEVNRYGEMVPELLLLHFIVWPIMAVAIARATE